MSQATIEDIKRIVMETARNDGVPSEVKPVKKKAKVMSAEELYKPVALRDPFVRYSELQVSIPSIMKWHLECKLLGLQGRGLLGQVASESDESCEV